MTIEIEPTAGRIGATVSGVALGPDLTAEDVRTIRTALVQRKVLFVRDQHHLTDEAHRGFAELLGPPLPHPSAEGDGATVVNSETGARATSWHTDFTSVVNPPSISVLRAELLPAYGGDTAWANTATAYDELPEPLARLADELWALHTNQQNYVASSNHNRVDDAYLAHHEKIAATPFSAIHPLVRVHPESGERSLLLGSFVQDIVDISHSDSQTLIGLYQSHVTRPENVVRWRWSDGDVALWDNRSTQHYAVNDYDPRPRRLRRYTVAGEVPVSVDGTPSRIVSGADHPWYASHEPVGAQR